VKTVRRVMVLLAAAMLAWSVTNCSRPTPEVIYVVVTPTPTPVPTLVPIPTKDPDCSGGLEWARALGPIHTRRQELEARALPQENTNQSNADFCAEMEQAYRDLVLDVTDLPTPRAARPARDALIAYLENWARYFANYYQAWLLRSTNAERSRSYADAAEACKEESTTLWVAGRDALADFLVRCP